MDSQVNRFKARLALLESMLKQMNPAHSRVKELRRSLFILKQLLREEGGIPSPYGPGSVIVRFSVH